MKVGIRSHGNGSRNPIKPNLDVNFGEYVANQAFLSINFFILVANNQDASTIHERVAYKLLQKMGIPTPRETSARLYINGQYFGFYNIVEHEDANFLQRNFGETGGYLSEWKAADFYTWGYLGSDPSVYAPFLDLKTNQAAANLPWFANLVAAINQTSSADFPSAISQYLNPQLYLTMAATESVVSEYDGLVGSIDGIDNFDIYQFQNSNLSEFIPWDQVLSFDEAPPRTFFYGNTSRYAG